ncbi:hypothetical protein SapgrDRAFT_2784 [Saprospira grandis DSM 2844]|uniref:Uncharacterized protein n=1 Tax=Saprospira grandis DSM 2844 TaxID=694433 RepID=J0P3M9_9BACT|nr:hypothetical protein SapgrDRAFT_2784 [Saprospira grandis DSM 2844]
MYRYSESVEVFFLQGEENLFFLVLCGFAGGKAAAGNSQI